MLLAKFYANQRSTEVIAQREIISKVEIETSLDDFGVAQLSIPIIDGVEEDSKIEIYEVGQNNDRRVFVGFIYEIKPVWQRRNMMDITARNEKGIMQKRKVLPGYDFKDKSVQEIVSTLLNEYAIYNDHWTSEIRFEKSISLELQQGDTYADIFDEIAEMTESYWDIMDGNVIFAENIGKQLPATIIYDGGSDNPGNISAIDSVGTATSCNVVIVEDVDGKTSINADFFEGFLKGVGSVSVRNGDIVDSAEIQAKRLSKPQRSYQISITDGSLLANVGDMVNVDVRNTNKYFDFKGEALINGKKILYENATKIISYSVGEFAVYPFTITKWQKELTKEIRLLRLKDMS